MAETLVSASVRSQLNYHPELLTYMQVGGVLFGDADGPNVASIITTLIDTTATGKIKIPDTYESVGYLSPDGVEHSEDISMKEQRGWGSTTVLRRDFESWDHTLSFSMMEDKRIAYDVATGSDTKANKMSLAGEWKHWRPSRPTTKYRRCLVIAQDYEGPLMVIKAKFFPRVSLTEKDSETWDNNDDVTMRNVTMGADDDSGAPGPMAEFLIGPGAKASAAARGITVDTA